MTKVTIDSSVVIASLLKGEPRHKEALRIWERVLSGKNVAIMPYSVLVEIVESLNDIDLADVYGIVDSLRVHSPQLAACAVIPADAGVFTCEATSRKPDWMPDQVRHDVQYPAACGGVVC